MLVVTIDYVWRYMIKENFLEIGIAMISDGNSGHV